MSMKGYLTVIGYVRNSTQVTWRLGYLSSTSDPSHDQRLRASKLPPVSVAQIDASGAILSTYQIPASDVHVDSVDDAIYVFAGKLPLDSATQQLTLAMQGSQLSSFTIPAHPPEIRLTWEPSAGLAGQHTITWEARHPDGAPLEYVVFYSHDGGQTYRQLSPSITETSYTVNFDLLAGGNGQIMVQATDGGNTISATSPIFAVPTKPVIAVILAPADQATVPGKWVTLQGQGFYLEEDEPELSALTWSSSVQGALGTGRIVQVTLRPGTHTITLTAGRASRQGTATLTLHVN
jgi:hypothetical protein